MDRIKFALNILKSPRAEFLKIDRITLDYLLGNYIVLLIISAVLSGIVTFILGVVRALYYNIFSHAEIDFTGVLNYSIGIGVSLMFFLIFCGTIILFFFSILLKSILRLPYIKILKILMYAAMPLLLFGWIPNIVYSLVVWSTFLLFIGLKEN